MKTSKIELAGHREVVVADPEGKVEPEILAEAIVRISDSMQRLSSSGLNRAAIEILASHASGIPQYKVRQVLNAMDGLRKRYCRR